MRGSRFKSIDLKKILYGTITSLRDTAGTVVVGVVEGITKWYIGSP